MQVEIKEVEKKPPFDAFDLVIRVESQAEADSLYALHNHAAVCKAVPAIEHEVIRCAVLRKGARRDPALWSDVCKTFSEWK